MPSSGCSHSPALHQYPAEASLTGLLILADVDSSQAALATLAYRMASYWLPLLAGPVAYGLFLIRYREQRGLPAGEHGAGVS